jgi:hypothetical protein
MVHIPEDLILRKQFFENGNVRFCSGMTAVVDKTTSDAQGRKG